MASPRSRHWGSHPFHNLFIKVECGWSWWWWCLLPPRTAPQHHTTHTDTSRERRDVGGPSGPSRPGLTPSYRRPGQKSLKNSIKCHFKAPPHHARPMHSRFSLLLAQFINNTSRRGGGNDRIGSRLGRGTTSHHQQHTNTQATPSSHHQNKRRYYKDEAAKSHFPRFSSVNNTKRRGVHDFFWFFCW